MPQQTDSGEALGRSSYINLDYRYDDATRVVVLRPHGDDDGPTFYLTYGEIRKLAKIVLPDRESDWEPLQLQP